MTIKLINASFEETDFSLIKDIKLSFLDPPDNVRIKYENYKDNLKKEKYIELLNCWTKKACSITNGPVFISFAEQWMPYMESIIMDNNIKLVQRIFWYYSFGQASQKKYTSSIRPIYWLNDNIIYDNKIRIPSQRIIKYNDKRGNPDGKLPDNMWNFSRIAGTFKERRAFHPCQHPEALIERIILGHSKEGETVCDPFLGSGTTAIVCKRLGRNCVGLDVSEFYLNRISEILNDSK
jgi:site-specific DNA-methyltransferase (adenine-specific)